MQHTEVVHLELRAQHIPTLSWGGQVGLGRVGVQTFCGERCCYHARTLAELEGESFSVAFVD